MTLAADGTISKATVGLTAVGLDRNVTEVEAVLVGQVPTEQLFAEAGQLAAAACDPLADQRGPIDYKRHLADELTRRVLRVACSRAAASVPDVTIQEG